MVDCFEGAFPFSRMTLDNCCIIFKVVPNDDTEFITANSYALWKLNVFKHYARMLQGRKNSWEERHDELEYFQFYCQSRNNKICFMKVDEYGKIFAIGMKSNSTDAFKNAYNRSPHVSNLHVSSRYPSKSFMKRMRLWWFRGEPCIIQGTMEQGTSFPSGIKYFVLNSLKAFLVFSPVPYPNLTVKYGHGWFLFDFNQCYKT